MKFSSDSLFMIAVGEFTSLPSLMLVGTAFENQVTRVFLQGTQNIGIAFGVESIDFVSNDFFVLHVSTYGLLPSDNIEQIKGCTPFQEAWNIEFDVVDPTQVQGQSLMVSSTSNSVLCLMTGVTNDPYLPLLSVDPYSGIVL